MFRLSPQYALRAGVENRQTDYVNCQILDQGVWPFHPEIFHQLCLHWGTLEVDLLAARLNRKERRFVARSRDPRTNAADALVAPWGQYPLLYVFLPLKLLLKLLRRIEVEGIPVILVDQDWPSRAWYADLVRLVADVPWRLPLREDLLSQGPIFHPALRSLALTAWLLRPRC